MPIQRIDIPKKHTHGYQARAVVFGRMVLTEFVSDKAKPGGFSALQAAEVAERRLQREAEVIRKHLPLIQRHLGA